MSKPRVITNCVANHYAGPTERIIEYSFPDGSGGLISLFVDSDGNPRVDLYRHDTNVQIVVGKADGVQR